MQRPQCDHLRPIQHCTSGAKITFLTHLILFYLCLSLNTTKNVPTIHLAALLSFLSSPLHLVFLLHLSLQGPLYGFLLHMYKLMQTTKKSKGSKVFSSCSSKRSFNVFNSMRMRLEAEHTVCRPLCVFDSDAWGLNPKPCEFGYCVLLFTM